MSTDLHTLSGAYAINALSQEEAEEFRKHLAGCTACQDEVRELQEAAALMGASEAMAPPVALKERVLRAADQTPQLPPKVLPMVARKRRWAPRLLVAAAAVVLAVAGGIGIIQSQQGPDDVMAAPVAQVFDAPDAHQVAVDTANGGTLVVATSADLGKMAVDTDELPQLGEDQTYQLWTIAGGAPESAGLVDDIDSGEAMDLPPAGTQVAITIEPAGGSEAPTTDPIVLVDPATV